MAKKARKPKPAPLTTGAIYAALRRRHESEEWAYFEEVRSQVGFAYGRKIRSADAVAFNTWESRGLELHGYEIKQDRRDVLRELKDPGKSGPVQQYCDRWWLAVGATGLITVEELPPTWGLLIPRGKSLIVKVQAPKLEPKPWPRKFIAVIMRQYKHASADEDTVAARISQAHSEGLEIGRAEQERNYHYAKKRGNDLQDKLDQLLIRERQFKLKAGLSFHEGGPRLMQVAATVRSLHDFANVERKLKTARAAAAAFGKLVASLEAIQTAEAAD